MNEHQFTALHRRAVDIWRRMEVYRRCYLRLNSTNSVKAERLKVGTLVLGALTGLSGLPAVAGVEIIPLLTGILGVVTGVATMADKLFRWEETANETWTRAKSLENMQSQLYQYVLDLGAKPSVDDVSQRLDQINERVETDTSFRVPGELIDSGENEAAQALSSHGISRIEYLTSAEIVDQPEDDALGENAEGVTVVRRGPAIGDQQ